MYQRMSKKVISLLLTLAMLCGLLLTPAFAADDAWEGSGTESDPYVITDQAGLEAINKLDSTTGLYFRVKNNITLNSDWAGLGSPTITSDSTTNSPVASGKGFAGTLQGDGDITITVDRTGTDSGFGGLVNYLAPGGTLKDLTIAGSVVNTGTGDAVGGAVGYNSGTITNVTNKATVRAEKTYNVGGVAGFNNGYYGAGAAGTITYGSNSGTITGFDKVGGITGENAGLISESWNTGAVNGTDASRSGIGGIAGRNGNNNTAVETGIILNCYNQGAISSGTAGEPSTQGRWVGGIVGFQNSLSSCTNCYNTGNLLGYRDVGNIVGSNDNVSTEKGLVNCYGRVGTGYTYEDGSTLMSETDMKDPSFVGKLNKGTSVWQEKAGDYPVLTNPSPSGDFIIALVSAPAKLSYTAGQTFSTEGLVIQALYASGAVVTITNYTVTPDRPLTTDDTQATVSGTYKDEPYSFSFDITVTAPTDSVYLDGTATEDGDGTEGSPYNNLSEAITAALARSGNIVVVGTVTISESFTSYDQVTFTRGFGLTEGEDDYGAPMFIIDVPNTGTYVNYVTLDFKEVNSGGVGTAFLVKSGRVRLRGYITVTKCEIAAMATGTGEVEINNATIEATKYSVYLSNSDNLFVLNSGGSTSIKGVVHLATGTFITVGNTIPSAVTIESEVTTANTVIAAGTKTAETPSGYQLTNADLKMLTVSGKNLTLNDNNQIVIAGR